MKGRVIQPTIPSWDSLREPEDAEMTCTGCGRELEGEKIYFVKSTRSYSCEECVELAMRIVLMLDAKLHEGEMV